MFFAESLPYYGFLGQMRRVLGSGPIDFDPKKNSKLFRDKIGSIVTKSHNSGGVELCRYAGLREQLTVPKTLPDLRTLRSNDKADYQNSHIVKHIEINLLTYDGFLRKPIWQLTIVLP